MIEQEEINWVVLSPQNFESTFIARTESKAKFLKKYMKEKHNMETRVFKTAFENVVHHKEWRIKTNKILMFEELFF